MPAVAAGEAIALNELIHPVIPCADSTACPSRHPPAPLDRTAARNCS